MKYQQLGFIAALVCAAFAGDSALGVRDWVAEWSCQPSQWTSGPTVSRGRFTGTLAIDCRLRANTGGTFSQLESALVQSVLDEAQAVHGGPTPAEHGGREGTYLDVTRPHDMDGMRVAIRSDMYFVHDEDTFVSEVSSKSIQASGTAKNLKKLDMGFTLSPDATVGWYAVRFTSSVEISKPPLVPVGIFKNTVASGMKEQTEERSEKVILEIAETL